MLSHPNATQTHPHSAHEDATTENLNLLYRLMQEIETHMRFHRSCRNKCCLAAVWNEARQDA